jgi:hypothetical protein
MQAGTGYALIGKNGDGDVFEQLATHSEDWWINASLGLNIANQIDGKNDFELEYLCRNEQTVLMKMGISILVHEVNLNYLIN